MYDVTLLLEIIGLCLHGELDSRVYKTIISYFTTIVITGLGML